MKIYVVGLGPGGRPDMTFRAAEAIKKADAVAGYDYYIELIRDMLDGKEIISTGMRKETERCKAARDCALSGKTVAVVSSGDAGVYGMAALMHEVCRDMPELDIEVVPGVTAACSGGAVCGAPLTGDFAVISLSDLLTPWETIEKRLRLAAQGDFAVVLYNPSSRKRADHLARACGYMLEYRAPDTPCAYVKNIGRDGEKYTVCTLAELKEAETDMFTTVFIGTDETEVINGRLITPRGYRDI